MQYQLQQQHQLHQQQQHCDNITVQSSTTPLSYAEGTPRKERRRSSDLEAGNKPLPAGVDRSGYVNSAYESPTNCDPNKSLISGSSSKESTSVDQTDTCEQVQEQAPPHHRPSLTNSVHGGGGGQRRSSKDSLQSNKSDRLVGKTIRRTDTPLYLPDNSDISKPVFFTGDVLGESQKQSSDIGYRGMPRTVIPATADRRRSRQASITSDMSYSVDYSHGLTTSDT